MSRATILESEFKETLRKKKNQIAAGACSMRTPKQPEIYCQINPGIASNQFLITAVLHAGTVYPVPYIYTTTNNRPENP